MKKYQIAILSAMPFLFGCPGQELLPRKAKEYTLVNAKNPGTKQDQPKKTFEGLEYYVLEIECNWISDIDRNKLSDAAEIEYLVRKHGENDSWWFHPIKYIDITFSNGYPGRIGVSREDPGIFVVQFIKGDTEREEPRALIIDTKGDGFKPDTDDRFYLDDEDGDLTQDLEDAPLAKKYTTKEIWGALVGDALKQLNKKYPIEKEKEETK